MARSPRSTPTASPASRGRSHRAIKALVREGWNQRSFAYRPTSSAGKDRTGHTTREYRRWLAPVLRELPRGTAVLDLGCGCGLPTSRWLADRFRVTGVDISDIQIARARKLVPGAHFLREDMTRVRFPAGSLGAVVALYSIIHVPLDEQRPLFRRIFRWLRPGGRFVTILGAGRYRGIEKGWLGCEAPMFWDHEGPEVYQRWLESSGFTVESHALVPEGKVGHELFQCVRPGGEGARPSRAPRPVARRGAAAHRAPRRTSRRPGARERAGPRPRPPPPRGREGSSRGRSRQPIAISREAPRARGTSERT